MIAVWRVKTVAWKEAEAHACARMPSLQGTLAGGLWELCSKEKELLKVVTLWILLHFLLYRVVELDDFYSPFQLLETLSSGLFSLDFWELD